MAPLQSNDRSSGVTSKIKKMKIKKKFVAAMASIVSTGALACSGAEDVDEIAGKLSIPSTTISFSQGSERAFITAMGVVKNSSTSCAQDLVVEVKYFDGSGKQVDVTTQPIYGVVVPANQEVAFRLREEADKQRDAYASAVARIVSAEPKFSASPKQRQSALADFLYSWGPMVLLIGVWLLVMRKYMGKNSPQQRSLALVERQTEILKRQVEVLERLAAAAEKKA
jgi:ATP-dependent Zn protease